MLMEGRELVFLKLLDAEANVLLNPPRPRNASNALAVAVSLTVGDIGLRDMQVRVQMMVMVKAGLRARRGRTCSDLAKWRCTLYCQSLQHVHDSSPCRRNSCLMLLLPGCHRPLC